VGKGRGLDSVEGKNNKQGLRFVLQTSEEGNTGWLVWQQDHIPALIDWDDPVIKHGLDQRIKYARLLRAVATTSEKNCPNAGISVRVALGPYSAISIQLFWPAILI
jgi:hypothetical protein